MFAIRAFEQFDRTLDLDANNSSGGGSDRTATFIEGGAGAAIGRAKFTSIVRTSGGRLLEERA